MQLPRSYEGVAVAVPVSTVRPRTTRRSVHWFFGQTLDQLIRQAGISKSDIDGLAVASYTLGPDNAASLAEYFDMEPRFILDLPYGGAAGVMAMTRAARAIQAGDASIIACLAADLAPSGYGIYSNFSAFTRDHIYPYGGGGANATFALITANYMAANGAVAEDFGRICVAQRANGAQHALTMFKKPLSMEDYLSARLIADPLRLFDCAMPVNGAIAVLVSAADRAKDMRQPPVHLRGFGQGHRGEPEQRGFDGDVRSGAALARDTAFRASPRRWSRLVSRACPSAQRRHCSTSLPSCQIAKPTSGRASACRRTASMQWASSVASVLRNLRRAGVL